MNKILLVFLAFVLIISTAVLTMVASGSSENIISKNVSIPNILSNIIPNANNSASTSENVVEANNPIIENSPTPVVAYTNIYLSPNPLTITSNQSSVNIQLDSKENNLTAVQLELSYNPKALTNVDIKPSDFFNNPVILARKVDSVNGKIILALASQPAETSTQKVGTIAIITFNSKLGSGQKTEIQPTGKNLVAASGINNSVLKEIIGTIIISQ